MVYKKIADRGKLFVTDILNNMHYAVLTIC